MSDFVPNDPNFFLFAVASLSAALLPLQAAPQATDIANAEIAAELCAQALDSGVFPATFLLPEYEPQLAESESLTSANKRNLTAYEQSKLNAELLQRSRTLGTPLTADQIKAKNKEHIAKYKDLSAPVRGAALASAVARLGAMKQVTGSHSNVALGVTASEIERAMRLAAKFSVSTEPLAAALEKAQKSGGSPALDNLLPYPANLGFAAVAGLLGGSDDAPASP